MRLSQFSDDIPVAMETVDDIFDPLLSLEEQCASPPPTFTPSFLIAISLITKYPSYYDEGYNEGLRDGERAGLIEGRLFGLEKGFDKFFELGQLQGRVSVWKARIPPSGVGAAAHAPTAPAPAPITNPRLIKQILQLEKIVSSPPTANDEESVEEVEDSLRRGKARVKVVSSMIGEKKQSGNRNTATGSGSGEPSIEEGSFSKNVRR